MLYNWCRSNSLSIAPRLLHASRVLARRTTTTARSRISKPMILRTARRHRTREWNIPPFFISVAGPVRKFGFTSPTWPCLWHVSSSMAHTGCPLNSWCTRPERSVALPPSPFPLVYTAMPAATEIHATYFLNAVQRETNGRVSAARGLPP